ncbi:MAG: hypothetical protein GPJ54_07770 [Candidatus Heimdallarchaeota archaeon]|nr:hypothetical protein [Candidatus Heimdallarchaeota archaeon]
MARRFYEEIHFKLNELLLYYNIPVITEEMTETLECHHIEKLRCSRANDLTPDQCINDRKCELYLNQELLFFEPGVDVKALQALDNALRKK